MFPDLLYRIETQFEQNLPFVAYRKPHKSSVKAFLQNNAKLNKTNDFTEEGFVFSPFDASRGAVLVKADEVLQSNFDITVERTSKNRSRTSRDDDKDKGFYLELITKGIDEIKKGTFKKVVLSRVVKEKYKDTPFAIFKNILRTYPSAFCYLWYHPKVGMWLGATPETLVQVENGRLITNSLAGTQLYAGGIAPVWGKKEKEEQQLVTQYILDALSGSVSNISVSDTRSVKAGDLLHLKTKISGSVKNVGLGHIISKLHPTPAVCGLPKLSSKSFILKNENYNREYYTGFLGEINIKSETGRSKGQRNIENSAYRALKKTTELYVNLRCMQLKKNLAHIYVGGGITKESVPEKEWKETVNKSTTMLRIVS